MSPGGKKADGGRAGLAQAFRDAGPLLGSGAQLAAAVVLMFFLGRWLDSAWSSSPWMTIVCTLAGAAGGLIQFVRTVAEVTRQESKEQHRRSSES